jgi:FKBP-type peptidyl-prolyl cis-trans isomerase
MRLAILSALCALSLPFASATIDDSQETNLKIEKVNQVDCSRPSKKLDRLKVHYHGALLDGMLTSILL